MFVGRLNSLYSYWVIKIQKTLPDTKELWNKVYFQNILFIRWSDGGEKFAFKTKNPCLSTFSELKGLRGVRKCYIDIV